MQEGHGKTKFRPWKKATAQQNLIEWETKTFYNKEN
jgi:hypothetical protein